MRRELQRPQRSISLLCDLCVLDEFTGEGLRIAVRRTFPARQVLAVLARLFEVHGPPAYLRSDNGPEFVALAVRGWLHQQQVQTLYIDPGCPWQNGYEERFTGTVRDEFLNSHAFVSVLEAQVLAAAYLREYNQERPHSSSGNQTRLEFKRDWYARQSHDSGLSHLEWPRFLGS